jgi:hypothetical protein
MREKILEHLRLQPFRPVRIELTNGTIHVIRHPDQAMVGQSWMVIGIPARDAPGPDVLDTVTVSLLHVLAVGAISAQPQPTAN